MDFEAQVIGQTELKVGVTISESSMHAADDFRQCVLELLTEQAQDRWDNNWSTAKVVWTPNPLNWGPDVIVNASRDS